jgi:hypothetical protein
MRRFACCVVCLGLLIGAASANDIRIYFGQPEYVPPTTAFVPEAHWGEVAPPGTYTLGIWAQVDYHPEVEAMDDWNCISLTFASTGDPVTISDFVMDNFDHHIGTGSAYRWEASSDFGGDDECLLAAVTTYGLGGLWAPEWAYGAGSTDWWSYTTGDVGEPGAVYHYWLGNVTLSCAGAAEVWFNVGDGLITRAGGSPDDRVFFGETDPNPWPFFIQPDFVFIPEPAAALLVLPAILLLRRR